MESTDSMAFVGLICKNGRCDTTALVRTIPETFKGLGLSQQLAFGSTKAMLAGMFHSSAVYYSDFTFRISCFTRLMWILLKKQL